MNKGALGVIVALIVFAVLLFVVIGKKSEPAKEGVKELKVEKIDKDAVTRFDVVLPVAKAAVVDAGPAKSGESDAPKRVVLEKDATATSWKVYDAAAPDKKYPADDALIKAALDAVGEFATGDLISNKKEKLADLEIDEAKGTAVKVSTKAGAKLDLVFGRAAKGGGSTVRTAGSNDVYVAKGRLGAVLKKEVAAWRKKSLFDNVKADDVVKVATTFADGKKLVVETTPPPAPPAPPDGGTAPPAPKAEWKLIEPAALPAGFRLDPAQLSRAGAAVAALRAQDFADGVSDDAAGLKDAHTVVEATLKDGKKLVVHVGKEDDKKRVFAKVDGDPQMYLLPGYSAKQLLRTLDDFRDITLLDVKADDIDKVTFKGAQGTVVVKKDGAEWKLVEPKKAPDGFDPGQIATQVASVLRTRATKVAVDAPKGAVAKPGPTVEIVAKGKKYALRFGEGVTADDATAPIAKDAKDPKKKPEPREYYAKGGVDDLTYVVAAFTRNRLDKPYDLFKKPPTPPQGMGQHGAIPGMENLPPDVRKKLEESMAKGDFPPH